MRQYELEQYTHAQLSYRNHAQLSQRMEQLFSLIFDRTQDDTMRARYLAQRVADMGIEALPNEERVEWFAEPKGFYNATDLNRVEKACALISEELRGQGYPIEVETKRDWRVQDFPTAGALERIRVNVKKLRDGFFTRPDTPNVPASLKYMDIEKANTIEEILYDLHLLYTALMEMTPQVAGFELGGV